MVLDLYARKVVGWAMSERMTAQLTCDALRMAFRRRKHPRGVILHSDRRLLKAHSLMASMNKKGDYYGITAMESWNHSLKVDAIHGERFATRQDAGNHVFEYIEIYYNRKRPHSGFEYLSPEALEQRYVA